MTNKKDNSRYQFNTNDINESRYVIEMIYRDIRGNRRLHRDIYEMNNNELHEKINGLIPDKASVSQIKMHSEKYKEEIKKFRERNLSWIEHDFHPALYLWFSLFTHRKTRFPESGRDDIFFRRTKATPETINNIITDILECYALNMSQLEIIENEINRAHEKYQKLTGIKRLGWLKNDEEQINWAYQYLKEKDRYFSRRYSIDRIHALTCIKVYYDLNINNKEVLYTFLEMSNAWNQKRYREKRKSDNKKALSGYISQDAKMKLTEMAKKARMPEYELIELLILEYYDTEKK
ncbi:MULTISPECIES: hypothetical protein [Proteus]|uniref:hypothetical protein n=1 Tax=Proteus TaxID=583 RepID=UPI001377F22E|nr:MULTISPECIES: hypothetical protein [Proteus]MEC4046070.1 hypothetical protein [Proteus mirabilis]NBL79230.1 hypothetical protein [Proteus sp. G2672]NBN58192.1 hypothetical protein [Proteus sp. G2639]QIF49663.1 hypothetical protein FU796_16220 [Proteus mirabilis]